MERDFMGLSAKDSVNVTEEFVDGDFGDSDLTRSTGIPRSLSNKAAAPHHLMSLKPDQDKKHDQQLGDFQNFGGANLKQQFSGGNHFATSHPVLPLGDFSGASKPWISCKTSSIPAQLTIFYGGTVSVFNDISPEKAQAIAFLAGNGCVPSNMAQSKLHPQAPASKPPAADQEVLNQNMPQGSGLPSPMPVSSYHMNQSGVWTANNEVDTSQAVCMATALVNNMDLPRVMSSIGTMISSALPQARRASLALFLEKRKERVMNAAPYKPSTMAPCTTSESNNPCFSTTSGVDSNSASICNM